MPPIKQLNDMAKVGRWMRVELLYAEPRQPVRPGSALSSSPARTHFGFSLDDVVTAVTDMLDSIRDICPSARQPIEANTLLSKPCLSSRDRRAGPCHVERHRSD